MPGNDTMMKKRKIVMCTSTEMTKQPLRSQDSTVRAILKEESCGIFEENLDFTAGPGTGAEHSPKDIGKFPNKTQEIWIFYTKNMVLPFLFYSNSPYGVNMSLFFHKDEHLGRKTFAQGGFRRPRSQADGPERRGESG